MIIKKFLIFSFTVYISYLYLPAVKKNWDKLESGLYWKAYKNINYKTESYNIYILKINPEKFELQLLTVKEKKHSPLSLKEWCKKYNLTAGINASMYLPDKVRSTGYMKNFTSINNPRINRQFGAFIVFNPVRTHYKKASIIDKTLPDWKEEIKKYNTIIQNYRIIDTKQRIVWKKDNNINSIISLGIDISGNVLFIFCPEKIATFSFAEIIKDLPIRIYNLSYLEGGYQASLYINHKNLNFNLNGKLFNSQKSDIFFTNPQLPNIIGIRKKK